MPDWNGGGLAFSNTKYHHNSDGGAGEAEGAGEEEVCGTKFGQFTEFNLIALHFVVRTSLLSVSLCVSAVQILHILMYSRNAITLFSLEYCLQDYFL